MAHLELDELLTKIHPTLDEFFIETFSLKRNVKKDQGNIEWASFYNSMSGISCYKNSQIVGYIFFAKLLNAGFLLKRSHYQQGILQSTRFDYYSEEGNFLESKLNSNETIQNFDFFTLDYDSSMMSHLLSILHFNYQQIKDGVVAYNSVRTLEQIANRLHRIGLLRNPTISNDSILQDEIDKTVNFEQSSSLKWRERQKIIKEYKQKRNSLFMSKLRGLGINIIIPFIILFFIDVRQYLKRLIIQPWSSLKGICFKYTLGVLIWFFTNVRDNLGYSVALAIYGPFTFYFITQPMNPHAMWAVGKVRKAYLDTAVNLSPQKMIPSTKPKALIPVKIQTQQSTIFPLSSKSAALDSRSFSVRMDDFKQMQINLEQNMVFAARMGRIEQMETQLNFPLIVESVWFELTQYQKNLAEILKKSPSPFYKNEIKTTNQFQQYLWDKLYRFILDYTYVVFDKDNEQTKKSFYYRRTFSLLNKMTKRLQKADKYFVVPKKLIAITKKSNTQVYNDLSLLKDESFVLRQKDSFSTDELRSYMTRHWEILFLQQNKVQESSNFALQTYVWSIRNFIWAHQTVFSLKNSNLRAVLQGQIPEQYNELYASLYNLMQLEFVSIKKELENSLPHDLEAQQRMILLKNYKNFLDQKQFIRK